MSSTQDPYQEAIERAVEEEDWQAAWEIYKAAWANGVAPSMSGPVYMKITYDRKRRREIPRLLAKFPVAKQTLAEPLRYSPIDEAIAKGILQFDPRELFNRNRHKHDLDNDDDDDADKDENNDGDRDDEPASR